MQCLYLHMSMMMILAKLVAHLDGATNIHSASDASRS